MRGKAAVVEASTRLGLNSGVDQWPARRIAWIALSSALRKRERSCLVKGRPPPLISPASRSAVMRLRSASAVPIESSSNVRPSGVIARAPRSTQRAASGTSAVIAMSPGPTRSAIQSSARSRPSVYRHPAHARVVRHPQPRIGDHPDAQSVAVGHAIHFVLHRTTIRIHVDLEHDQDPAADLAISTEQRDAGAQSPRHSRAGRRWPSRRPGRRRRRQRPWARSRR